MAVSDRRIGPPIILYDYRTTRGEEHPRNFLAGFGGYLHVDGYSVYHKVQGVTFVGCWAHARRKFDEALKALPVGQDKTRAAAQQGLAFCNELFVIWWGLFDAYKNKTPFRQPTVTVVDGSMKKRPWESPKVSLCLTKN